MVRRKVLIVDDDPRLIRSLDFVFKQEGYEFDTAGNGEEAIEKVREGEPGVVLLDIMMPLKNGYDVCKEIKTSPDLSDTYIIVLSAKTQEIDRVKGYAAGADDYITKPFSPKAIVVKVKELLGDSH